MNAILLYDEVDICKNQWFINHFIDEASKQGISLILLKSSELYSISNMPNNNSFDWSKIIFKPDFVINRSRDSYLSSLLENEGIKSYNSSEVIKIANNKDLTYKYFQSMDIECLPYICNSIDNFLSLPRNEFLTSISVLGYPLVLKPTDGHGGKDISLVTNNTTLIETLSSLYVTDKSRNFIIQKFASDPGLDLRVYVMGNKILAGILRSSISDFRSNFSLGGQAALHNLSKEESELVARISSAFNSDFIGIDFVYNNGMPILNEIEDAVGCRMLYSSTDIDVIPLYLNHIQNSLS